MSSVAAIIGLIVLVVIVVGLILLGEISDWISMIKDTVEDVGEWLRTPLEEEEEDDLASPEARLEDVLSFFSETEVVEGGIDDLGAVESRVGLG